MAEGGWEKHGGDAAHHPVFWKSWAWPAQSSQQSQFNPQQQGCACIQQCLFKCSSICTSESACPNSHYCVPATNQAVCGAFRHATVSRHGSCRHVLCVSTQHLCGQGNHRVGRVCVWVLANQDNRHSAIACHEAEVHMLLQSSRAVSCSRLLQLCLYNL